MLTPSKRPRTQSSELNEPVARKLAKLKHVDESGDHIEESPQTIPGAAPGHTFNAIGTSGTVTMVAGDHTTNIDYHMYSTPGREIHTWMKAPDTSPSYNAARKKNQAGTGSWLLDGTQFCEWKERPGSVLWLCGGPGCGKTILSSSAIENIVELCQSKPASRGYAYFFFDGTKAQSESLSYDSLLRSIILQLSDRCGDNMPHALVHLHTECDGGHRQPSESQLENALSQILDIFDSTYLVIDSLDECVEKADLLRWIQSVSKGASGKLHLILASRLEAEIEQGLMSLGNLRKISVGSHSTLDDINTYLDVRLRAPDMNRWNEPEKCTIKTALSGGSQGMFRWVSLQVDAINKCKNKRELKVQLNSLPKGLDATYTRIFERSECPDYLERLMQWLVFSKCSLTVAELAEVLAVDFSTGDVPFYDPDLQCKIPALIWSICNGLVTEFEGTVKLAHFSVKEYVVKRVKPKAEAQFSTSEQFSHSLIAQDCIAQLLHFDGPSILDWEEPHSTSLDNIGSLFPLAQYAAMNWVSHFQSAAAAPTHCLPLQNLLLRLFKSPPNTWSHALLCWVRLQNLAIEVDNDLRHNRDTVLGRTVQSRGWAANLALDVSPLYYACFSGSLHAVQHLISNGADVNKAGQEASTRPILLACEEGHLEIARLLLDGGANVNVKGGLYGTALQAAIAGVHLELAKLLLAKGADVNVEGGSDGTALQAASAFGYLELAKLLLDKRADVNVKGGEYGSALQAASAEGHFELAKLLLDKGADVNLEGGEYGSALQAASVEGHLELAKLLLDKGADINLKGGGYGSALHEASAHGNLELARLLLDKGANVNGEEGLYGSALQAASARGHLEIAKLLLDKGANVNVKGGLYGTALQAAIAGVHLELAKLLLAKGADVNVEGGSDGTALQAASAFGYLELAKLLLDKRADVNVKGGEYGSALQAASAEGHFELAKLLLDKGADVNLEGGEYGSALQAASVEGHLELAKLLLDKGADINLKGGGYGRTVRRAASFYDHVEIAQLLWNHVAVD
ncbi:hypothetical protein HWV62_9569 [Athelia sp. TMB]|nr:hypothetical protein HWV62_9569 [Athelia sp. TMB]